MNKSPNRLVLLSLLAVFGMCVTALSVASDKIKIEGQRKGISAALIDQGDYYNLPNGQAIRFFRKKDIYVVTKKATNANRGIATMQRYKAQFGDRVEIVTGHQLGGLDVVRINNQPLANAKRSFNITPHMLKSLDSSTQSIMPVFTTEHGQADLLLLPKVTIELNSTANDASALAKLSQKYGLSLVRKLKLSANVYSMAFNNSRIDPSRQFSKVRQIGRESFVEWAEPQFYVKPIKQEFTPNDSLIGQQWNLIDPGFRGSRCDTDCDANNAWDIGNVDGVGAVTGSGMVIAVVDDGVELDHPDLIDNIW
ncbi:MAG: hypothetical protein JKX81_10685, partial [Arenicella sp.]|nr:hypothetical protein [Arenicella sp.]